jgi:polyhydroxyalkanoate synthesis regulator phasin
MNQAEMKKKLETIVGKVKHAEKNAEKQVREAMKSAEKFRETQMKNVQSLIKQARSLKKEDIAARAEQVRKDLEKGASQGFELLLAKLNVPTRGEVDRLNKRISALQKKIDEFETSSKS